MVSLEVELLPQVQLVLAVLSECNAKYRELDLAVTMRVQSPGVARLGRARHPIFIIFQDTIIIKQVRPVRTPPYTQPHWSGHSPHTNLKY